MTYIKHWRRGATAAVAAVSAMAIAAPGATAAAGAPDVFAAAGEALALELNVKTPAGLLSTTGVLTDTINQKISFTEAALNSDGLATATASLLDGSLRTVGISSSSGQAQGEQSFLDQDIAGLVQIGVGRTSYVADAVNNVSKSFSELAYIKGSLAPLFDGSTLPSEVAEPVQGAVQDVTEVANGLVDTLNGIVDGVEEQIRETTGDVVTLPEIDVPTIPDVTTIDLFEIKKIWSNTVLEAVDGLSKSTVEAGITEASLLGGLVQVPAFQYTSWAQAGGTPGSADAGYDITTIAVRVADSDVVKVAGDRITIGSTIIDLSDLGIGPVQAGDIIQQVTDNLTSLLNTLGVSFAQGKGVTDVAPDGSRASAATSAFTLQVAPLHAAGMTDTLSVGLNLLPTKAAASAAVAPAPAPAPAPNDPPAMPRTGGGAAAMVFGALAMGGAGFLRRRF